ncbi:hypothetical protein PR048_021952 [Dryococelus australis]|uniref:Uncharacterized protein n=1 Tax=Dryococelus australis TaxID=614101 RepID=A0ABQ9GZQ9_9NEOP|nr:hypothetical protein PR048_021952 [Dryococelus australis]
MGWDRKEERGYRPHTGAALVGGETKYFLRRAIQSHLCRWRLPEEVSWRKVDRQFLSAIIRSNSSCGGVRDTALLRCEKEQCSLPDIFSSRLFTLNASLLDALVEIYSYAHYSYSKWGRSGPVARAISSGALLAQWIERFQEGPRWLNLFATSETNHNRIKASTPPGSGPKECSNECSQPASHSHVYTRRPVKDSLPNQHLPSSAPSTAGQVRPLGRAVQGGVTPCAHNPRDSLVGVTFAWSLCRPASFLAATGLNPDSVYLQRVMPFALRSREDVDGAVLTSRGGSPLISPAPFPRAVCCEEPECSGGARRRTLSRRRRGKRFTTIARYLLTRQQTRGRAVCLLCDSAKCGVAYGREGVARVYRTALTRIRKVVRRLFIPAVFLAVQPSWFPLTNTPSGRYTLLLKPAPHDSHFLLAFLLPCRLQPSLLRKDMAPFITFFVPVGMPEMVIERVINFCYTHGAATQTRWRTPSWGHGSAADFQFACRTGSLSARRSNSTSSTSLHPNYIDNDKKKVGWCAGSRRIILFRSSYLRHSRFSFFSRSRGGVVVRLLASHQGNRIRVPAGSPLPQTGFSHVGIVPDGAAGRRVFSRFFRFPLPCIPALLHIHLLLSTHSFIPSLKDLPPPLRELRTRARCAIQVFDEVNQVTPESNLVGLVPISSQLAHAQARRELVYASCLGGKWKVAA